MRVGLIDGEIVVNPTMPEMALLAISTSIVAGTADAILMVEAGAKEVPEETDPRGARRRARRDHAASATLQVELQQRGRQAEARVHRADGPRRGRQAPSPTYLGNRLEETIYDPDKADPRGQHPRAPQARSSSTSPSTYDAKTVGKVFGALEKDMVRPKILEKGKRPDGRSLTEIRPVTSEVGVLPRDARLGACSPAARPRC